MEAAAVCVADVRRLALRHLPEDVACYYEGGADDEVSLADNEATWKTLKIRPRMLRGVGEPSLNITLLGHAAVQFPIGVAPTALHGMAHSDGERATAAACAKVGALYVHSTLSSVPLEAATSGPRWFQLYVCRDRSLTARLVRRAEDAGYSAIVLTVDAPRFGLRRSDASNNFTLPDGIKFANLDFHGVDNFLKTVNSILDPNLTWDDVTWLKNLTNLPIVVKGILTEEDAELAVKAGVDAVWVSNHGGRQLDGVLSTTTALEEVAGVLEGTGVEVYVDGGVRTGGDVLRALALGAKAVFVGRPAIWGLAAGGAEGVAHVLQLLRDELKLAMQLAGCPSLDHVGSQLL